MTDLDARADRVRAVVEGNFGKVIARAAKPRGRVARQMRASQNISK